MSLRRSLERVAIVYLPWMMWVVLLYLTASLHRSSIFANTTICGPWGCGPTNDALVAIHMTWLVAISLPLIYLNHRHLGATQWRFTIGKTAVVAGGVLAAMIVAWQWFVWLPGADEYHRQFIWQRCGFAIATATDWPAIELLVSGLGSIGVEAFASRNAAPTQTAASLSNSVE